MENETTPKKADNGNAEPEGDAEERKVLSVGGAGTVLYANPRKTQFAPKFAGAPVIDGDLSDPVWKTTPCVGGFTKLGLEHPFVDAQTTVRVGWDDQNLYLGITCFEPFVRQLKATAHGTDSPAYGDDAIELMLAPFKGQPKEYFQLVANSADGSYDSKGFDAKWNGTWKHAAKIGEDRWTLEIAVPFETLGASRPAEGTLWRWLVARDRQAGQGVDALSALPEMSGGWHTPDEFDKLRFTEQPLDVAAEEKKANAAFSEASRETIRRKLLEAENEFASGKRILSRAKVADTTAEAGREIESWISRFKEVLSRPDVSVDAFNELRSGFPAFEKSLRKYAALVNRLGFETAANLPKNLSPGVNRGDHYWTLSSPLMTAAIDPSTGILCGLYDRNRQLTVSWSYDIYYVETAKDLRKSDERMDDVLKAEKDGDALTLTCTNQALPGVTLVKRYFLKGVGKEARMLAKEVTISGDVPEKTLLTLVSRTCFDEKFRDNAYYHRVKPAGTMGDPRTVFRAKDIKDPVMLYFLFNVGSAANLCAVDIARNAGVGQYWFKANGKWVMPAGSDTVKSYFTDSGWDLSWFATFIGKTPQSGEMRYHLFDGDRTAFHQEYRDLPERLAVVDAIPVGKEALGKKYNLNLGPLGGLDDPFTGERAGAVLPFMNARLRSHEYSSHFAVPYNDLRHGDYPAGDNAVLHTEYGKTSKTYPAVKVREGMLKAKEAYPRILSGWYHTPQNICFHSGLAKEHPDWIMKGKDGKPVPSGWHPDFGVGDFSPGFVDEIVKRLARQMDYFDMQLMYLDYTIPACIWVDWGNGVVRYSDAHYDFLQKLYREVRKRNGVLFLNGATFDGVHDIGYWEGFSKYESSGQHWRDVADSFMCRRIYDRPGVRTIPLYWHGGDMFGDGKNYRDYSNLILSQLLMSTDCWHDPYDIHFKDPQTGKTDWVANQAHAVPYHDFSTEVGWTTFQDVNLQPCWWRDFDTKIEAYAFAKGPAFIFTALRHEELTKAPEDFALSADLKKMGFAPDNMTFVWQFHARDPDQFPRRAGLQNQPDWDKLFVRRTCAALPGGSVKERLEIALAQVEPFLTRLAVATQVPAVFASLDGQPVNLLLPEMLGCRIDGNVPKNRTRYTVKVSSVYPGEILLFRPQAGAKVRLGGAEVAAIEEKFGETTLLRVKIPVGDSKVEVR